MGLALTVHWTVRAKPDRAPQCETSSPSTPARNTGHISDLCFLDLYYQEKSRNNQNMS